MNAVAQQIQQEQYVMDQAEQCRRLAHVLTLTKQMLAHANNDEWQQVTELEIERRDDLAACFANVSQAADSILVAEAVAALLHLNEELMAKLKVARSTVMEQGRNLARQQNAANSYEAIEKHR